MSAYGGEPDGDTGARGAPAAVRWDELFTGLPARLLVTFADPPRFTVLAATRTFSELFPAVPEAGEPDAIGRWLDHANPRIAAGADVIATVLRESMRSGSRALGSTFDLAGARWLPRCSPIAAGEDGVAWLVVELIDLLEFGRGEESGRNEGRDAMVRQERASAELLATQTEARATAEAASAAAEVERRAAVDANRAKTTFLANMSHELRTPLNAIQGYVQLIEMGVAGPLTGRQREYLNRMRDSSRHLLELVDEVLDIAKVDAGQMQLSVEQAFTGEAIAAALGLTQPQAEAKRITVVDESASRGSSPYVGDPTRVRQILINLLDNAIKFTHAGGAVTVRCEVVHEQPIGAAVAPPGPWTRIQVIDTGIGISARQQQSIFEPFVQADDRLTRRVGGTGLGLTISRRLARLMGGDLTLRSRRGEGSIFSLWLPATPASNAGRSDAREPAREVTAVVGDQPSGLAEAGRYIVAECDELIESWMHRLRDADAAPLARTADRTAIIDHYPVFLVNLGQSLLTVEDGEGVVSGKLQDGGEIQRTIADLHGRQRHRIGWGHEAIDQEYALLEDELTTRLTRYASSRGLEVRGALAAVQHLLQRARATSHEAWRRQARNGRAGGEPPAED